MIVWSGFGITILIFWGLCSLLFVEVFGWNESGLLIALFPTAIFSFIFGSIVNANAGDYEENYGHTLFYIRMEYWSIICLLIGILGLIFDWG